MKSLLDVLRQDISYAFRGMRRAPGYWLAVVAVLGIGAGANAAVFDVLDRLLVRAPAGVERPGDLKRLSATLSFLHGPRQTLEIFSAPDQDALRNALSGVADIASYAVDQPVSLNGGGRSTTVAYVTTNYFNVLGVKPRAGRSFVSAEANFRDPRYVAVISDALWRRQFGADASIVGRTILIDTVRFVVIGVAAPSFSGLELDPVDLWAPLPARPTGMEPWIDEPGVPILQTVVRLRPGATATSIATRATAAYRRFHAEDLGLDSGAAISAEPLVSAAGLTNRREVSDRSISMVMRLAGVAILLLLLTACNVGGLQLMRVASRRSEIAIRLALGGSVPRVARQLLTEAAIVVALASIVAIELASVTSSLLRRVVFANIRWGAESIDGTIVFLAVACVMLVTVVAALAPVASITWRNTTGSLQLSPASEHRNGARTRSILLVVQTALCIALLSAAGAVVVSLRRASSVDVGIDAARLITVSATGHGVRPDQLAAMRHRLEAYPFVAAVAQAADDIRPGGHGSQIQLSGKPVVAGGFAPRFNAVGPEYFAVAGLRLREGRPFNTGDIAGAEEVAVISTSMAREYWPTGDAIGSCFTWGTGACRRVVGIVDDVRWGFSAPATAHYFVSLAQQPQMGNFEFLVRTRDDVTSAELAVIQDLSSSLLSGTNGSPTVRGVAERLAPLLKPLQVASAVFLLFGGLAFLSALAGIFGTVSFDTARRYREIGIRIALGADSQRIVTTILGSVVRLIGAGIAAGLLLLAFFERFLAAILYGTSLYSSWITWAVMPILLVTGLLAGLLPAMRAARTDPADVLSAE